jgi:putative transcriptional regulator
MTKKTANKRPKLNAVERDLLKGLQDFAAALESDGPLPKQYTSRRVVLDLAPHAYSPAEVRATRSLLQASQALFAQFLGVSIKTIQSWEGGKPPSDMAARFMDEIRRNPEYWRGRLRQSAKVKAEQ